MERKNFLKTQTFALLGEERERDLEKTKMDWGKFEIGENLPGFHRHLLCPPKTMLHIRQTRQQ